MLDFPSKTINLIKETLLKQQKEVEKNIKEVENEDPATTPFLAETSEPGTDSYIADIHTKTLAIEASLKNIKGNIAKALIKIKNGNYGKCEKCKKQIEMARLLAMPTAQCCLSCSKKTSR